MPAGTGSLASSPRSSRAISSAVARASVLMRHDSTSSSPSKQPMTVLVLPTSMVSSMVLASGSCVAPQVDTDVEHRRGVGERTDRQEVDARLGDGAGPVEGQPTGGLELGPARSQPDR